MSQSPAKVKKSYAEGAPLRAFLFIVVGVSVACAALAAGSGAYELWRWHGGVADAGRGPVFTSPAELRSAYLKQRSELTAELSPYLTSVPDSGALQPLRRIADELASLTVPSGERAGHLALVLSVSRLAEALGAEKVDQAAVASAREDVKRALASLE